jgi:hypothetical protein
MLASLLGAVLAATAAVAGAPAATSAEAAAPPAAPAAAARAAAPLSAYTAGGLVAAAGAPGPAAAAPSGFGSVGNCTFYATSALAGGYCLSGRAYGTPQSLREWLDGRPFSYCRHVDVPQAMWLHVVHDKPDGKWMLKICIQDVDFTRPWGGTGTSLEVYTEWVPDGTDTRLPPYMEQFWNIHDDRNYYPLPRITVGPTNTAYVGTYTYLWARWVKDWGDIATTTEPEYRIPYHTSSGTVYLHAWITDLTVHPGRPDMEPKQCGDAETPFHYDYDDYVPVEQGGEQPSRCWFVYTHSSADHEDRGTVIVRANANWRVRVEDAAGNTRLDLGHHFYVIDRQIAVAEIQSIVDSDPTDW